MSSSQYESSEGGSEGCVTISRSDDRQVITSIDYSFLGDDPNALDEKVIWDFMIALPPAVSLADHSGVYSYVSFDNSSACQGARLYRSTDDLENVLDMRSDSRFSDERTRKSAGAWAKQVIETSQYENVVLSDVGEGRTVKQTKCYFRKAWLRQQEESDSEQGGESAWLGFEVHSIVGRPRRVAVEQSSSPLCRQATVNNWRRGTGGEAASASNSHGWD